MPDRAGVERGAPRAMPAGATPVRGSVLAHAAWNIVGQLAPLAAGLLALPWLIRAIGLERFSLLSLVWVLVGYAGVLDLGIGRAAIRTVAAHLARDDRARADDSAHAAIVLLAALGLLLGALLAAGGGWLVDRLVQLPPGLHAETGPALLLLAASVPFVMLANGYGGLLNAHRRFAEFNAIRVALGTLAYLAPLAVAVAGWPQLPAVVGVVLAVRIVEAAVPAWVVARRCGFRLRAALPGAEAARELLQLGGWMAVTNVVGPLLTYLDRLLVGALVPLRTVAHYATPYDLASRALLLPMALVAALFPLAAAVRPGSPEADALLARALRALYLVMVPLCFVLVALARPGLELWLGTEFAEEGGVVLQILAVGLLLNALAQAPAMLIQAAGEPRSMALLHLAELPLFVALLWGLTAQHGIVGTALAASLRFALDAAAVAWLARRVACGRWRLRPLLVPAAVALALLAAAARPWPGAAALAVCAVGLALFGAWAWWLMFTPGERARGRAIVRGAFGRAGDGG